jgi:hypothetical protein
MRENLREFYMDALLFTYIFLIFSIIYGVLALVITLFFLLKNSEIILNPFIIVMPVVLFSTATIIVKKIKLEGGYITGFLFSSFFMSSWNFFSDKGGSIYSFDLFLGLIFLGTSIFSGILLAFCYKGVECLVVRCRHAWSFK